MAAALPHTARATAASALCSRRDLVCVQDVAVRRSPLLPRWGLIISMRRASPLVLLHRSRRPEAPAAPRASPPHAQCRPAAAAAGCLTLCHSFSSPSIPLHSALPAGGHHAPSSKFRQRRPLFPLLLSPPPTIFGMSSPRLAASSQGGGSAGGPSPSVALQHRSCGTHRTFFPHQTLRSSPQHPRTNIHRKNQRRASRWHLAQAVGSQHTASCPCSGGLSVSDPPSSPPSLSLPSSDEPPARSSRVAPFPADTAVRQCRRPAASRPSRNAASTSGNLPRRDRATRPPTG